MCLYVLGGGCQAGRVRTAWEMRGRVTKHGPGGSGRLHGGSDSYLLDYIETTWGQGLCVLVSSTGSQ